MSITIGTDPELFLKDTRTGMVMPAVGLIGGTKGEPIPVPDLGKGFGLQEDNVMVEFNIPPAATSRHFARRVSNMLSHITQLVHTSQENMTLDVGACARLFSSEQLNTAQAMVFGCSVDYNAHEAGQAWPTVRPEMLEDEDGAWRFAGGHVHLGYTSAVPQFVAASFADVFLGLPSVGLDQQGLRRKLYGQAGRYRPTEWGIEYRTLSNFWIWDTYLCEQVGARAIALCSTLEFPEEAVQKWYAEIPWIDVRRAINDEDEQLAADLITYCTHDLGLGGI